MKKITWAEFREQERAKALKWMFYILYPLALFGVLFFYFLRFPGFKWVVILLMALNLVAVGICLGAIGVHIIRFSDTMKTSSKRIGVYIPDTGQCAFLSISGGITGDQVVELQALIQAAAKTYWEEAQTYDGFDIYDVVSPWLEEKGLSFEADFNYEDYRIFIGSNKN